MNPDGPAASTAHPDPEAVGIAQESLERLQEFDVSQLPRVDVLGQTFSFQDAVGPARRLVALYNRLPLSVLEDLPAAQLNNIAKRAAADFNRFQEALDYDPATMDKARHSQLIENLRSAYDDTFALLHPYIAYALYKTADFRRLEDDARAAHQTILDRGQELETHLEGVRDAADLVLADVRAAAAEQGVTQQATFFKQAADEHEDSSRKWGKLTAGLAVILVLYSLATLYAHAWPGPFRLPAPTTTYLAFQTALGKVLVFSVLSSMLYLAARNFMAHQHNAVINRHRQHALMTYKALVDAAGETPHGEVILTHAAACIFGPQSTGFGGDGATGSTPSVVELLTKPLSGARD